MFSVWKVKDEVLFLCFSLMMDYEEEICTCLPKLCC